MGLFNKVFGKGTQEPKEARVLPWKHLTSLNQLDQIAKDSKSKPVAIYKHSTTCGISRMVLRGLEADYDIDASQLDFYYLDLKAYRNVSNEIAARFQVWHESPQMILIKNGTAVYNASHSAVNVFGLKEKI